MNKLTSWKRIGSLLLTLAMVFTMSVTALPVYAAGTGTISVKYNPKIKDLDSTDFVLYKVGGYEREGNKSIVVLEKQFKDSGVIFPNSVGPDDPNWENAWFGTARDLGKWAKNHESELTSAWNGSLNQSGEFQTLKDSTGADKQFPNGVYLLVGKEKLVGEEFWTPVPVLIQVLNDEGQFTFGEEELEVKMTNRPLVHKHIVKKIWQEGDYSDGRPGSVKIGIFCGDTKMDTVEFNNDKGYIYTWYSYLDKASGKWVYTSKDPENDKAEGVETEKLNESNTYQLKFDGENKSWGTEEMPHQGVYEADENTYVVSYPETPDAPGADDVEAFDIVNTVVIPVKHDPPVKKTIVGDEPEKDETFEFVLVPISTTANVKSMPMPEGSDGNICTIETKGEEEKEFGEITFRVPGLYKYEVKELKTGKKGYTYDNTTYRLEYDISITKVSDSVYKAEKQLTVYKNDEKLGDNVSAFEFVNEYTGDTPDKPGKKPNTGDYTNYVLPAAIFAAALIALIIMFVRRKQNNNK